jgi:tetraacyldisaccharide 4'-kinase
LILTTSASAVYGAIAERRRRWYAGDPSRQRRLARPVVSVGNLRVGGAGKTPLVAALAQMLVQRGERPAILMRGYARRRAPDGVTVVSNGQRVCAGLDVSGDEALMLSRGLTGVAVLVGADRFLSGVLAERRFGATIHLLDDGFQHLALARDLDLLVVDEDDLSDRVLPAGRLREPLASAARADALLTAATRPAAIERFRSASGGGAVFRIDRALGRPHGLRGGAATVAPEASVFAVAGIARPQRFFADLTAAGWRIAGSMAFRDHHPYRAADGKRIVEAARAAGATTILTTEKDAVRMERLDGGALPIAAVPLTVTIDPAFDDWLSVRLGVRGVPA